MSQTYDFFIAGRTRNKEKILQICSIFDEFNISYYCFLKNEKSHTDAGLDVHENPEELMRKFESMPLESQTVQIIFKADMEGERNSKNFLLVLPAGKSAHIEAGVAYGLGKKCYAIGEYEATDSLYLIFDKVFADENELREFLNHKSKGI